MQVKTLIAHLDNYLNVSAFKDYAPNGLQVEGKKEIHSILLGVTASQAFIDEAVRLGADAVIVHHGWFWRGESACVVGMKRRRLKTLLVNDINLLAYHLPLDAHPEVGNNACLGRLLGLKTKEMIGGLGLVCVGEPVEQSIDVEGFVAKVQKTLGRKPLVLGRTSGEVKCVGWCSGAAQDSLQEAVDAGCDLFLSGEVSERTTHEARENGVTYLAAGHHATERYGIQALGEHLKAVYPDLKICFFDDDNPV